MKKKDDWNRFQPQQNRFHLPLITTKLIPSSFNHNTICSQKTYLIPPKHYVHGGCIISCVIIWK